MKKRIPLLVAFFMVLYIVSLISIPTYVSSTIPAQPNMTKEFSESAYLDESPYSVDIFSETLDDDVFYTPDGFYDETPVTASQGYGDWADSIHFNDSQYWSSFDTIDEYALFRGDHSIEGFEYSIYGRAGSANGNVTVYDTMIQDQYVLEEMVVGSDAWYNGSYWGTNYEPTQVYLILEAGTGGAITVDYIELRFHYLPLVDYSYSGGFTNYGESLSDVSDIPYLLEDGLEVGEYGGATDGDVWENWMVFNDTGNEYIFYQYVLPVDLTGCEYYLEFNFKAESSQIIFQVYVDDDEAGVGVYAGSGSSTTSWTTVKTYLGGLGLSQISSVNYYFSDNPNSIDSGNLSIYLDYLRISPSDEMGFQHDGSTTLGISDDAQASVTYSYSTDGDFITLNGTRDSAVVDYMDVWFEVDTTSTEADIERDYYQFLSFSVYSFSTVGCSVTWGFIGDGYLISGQTLTTGINRANIKTASTSNPAKRVLWFSVAGVDSGDTFEIVVDWVKIYSIANFTVTQSTVGTNEYAYVTGGELHFNMDGDSDYILLNYDPTISVDSATYNRWILDIDNIGTGTSHTDDFGIDFYVGAWQGYTYDETNSTMPTGITTDFRIISYDAYSLQSIIFWDAHTWRIVDSKIIYFDLPEWHLVESVSIIIWLEILTWGLDVFLILLGMFMVPASTLYLVKGGKNNMSTDKVFYFIVAFLFGWGLIFIGVS